MAGKFWVRQRVGWHRAVFYSNVEVIKYVYFEFFSA